MKITSGPDRVTSGRPAGLTRRHAQAAGTALLGLVVLAGAQGMPWVAVRPGQPLQERLLGVAPSTELRTYTLGDLPGPRAALYAGWALLVALLVTAWVRPHWPRGPRTALAVLAAVLGVLTFLAGGAAVRASGFPTADHPDTDFLAGAWLALLGVFLLAGAVAVLAGPPRPADTAAVRPVEPPAATATGEDDQPGPLVVPRPGWAWNPPRAPWWRRPGPVTGVVAAALAGAVLLGGAVWLAAHPPARRHGELAALVVARPAGSTPADPAAVEDRLDVTRLLPLDRDMRALVVMAQLRNDVRHAAGTAWVRPDHGTVTVTLLQFDSPDVAAQFQRSYVELERSAAGPGGVVEVAGVPGAMAFAAAVPHRAEVHGVAGRDEIVVLVTAAGGPADGRIAVESALREQYARL